MRHVKECREHARVVLEPVNYNDIIYCLGFHISRVPYLRNFESRTWQKISDILIFFAKFIDL